MWIFPASLGAACLSGSWWSTDRRRWARRAELGAVYATMFSAKNGKPFMRFACSFTQQRRGMKTHIFLIQVSKCKFLKTPPLSFPCEHPIWKYLKTVSSLLKLQHWIMHLYGQNASTNSGGNRMRCCGRCTWSKLYVFIVFSWHVWHWAECGIVFLVNTFFFLFL